VWIESWCRGNLMFECNSCIDYNLPVINVFVLCEWNSSTIEILHTQYASWLFLDGLTLDVKVSYERKLILLQYSGWSILVCRFFWMKFSLFASNKINSLKLVPNVILLKTLVIVSETMGIVTTMIGSRAKVSTQGIWAGVVGISKLWQGTDFRYCNG